MAPKANKAVDRTRWPYRMRDLCERTGLDRQTIHFYITKQLVPEGFKTGRNMAYYGEEHLERLRLVLELKNERFLPLDTIRAVLNGDDDGFTPEQRSLLSEVKGRVSDVLGPLEPRPDGSPRERVRVSELVERYAITAAELTELDGLGLLNLVATDAEPHLPADDLWLVELWHDLRGAGFTRERGFEVADLALYADTIRGLFQAELRTLTPRLARLPADEVAELFRKGLPLINAFLTRFHQAKARDFFRSLD
ncbi:hypothetical protein PPSIR1_37519 [Plesiocystis pacifica SIR-1]|uniref:HTH merR-type domain-containing protein n=1 Tax=Plesiocystis pacifica SIR-1 TaxID=391625 RepID=A6GB29_9BACT|nr:MerR family transcriptional regulator [Plesiocystis pacifica]EDM76911.1 hypothetical protein PPSIR1_37519 [Plesiocystis pacifica SIR-1]